MKCVFIGNKNPFRDCYSDMVALQVQSPKRINDFASQSNSMREQIEHNILPSAEHVFFELLIEIFFFYGFAWIASDRINKTTKWQLRWKEYVSKKYGIREMVLIIIIVPSAINCCASGYFSPFADNLPTGIITARKSMVNMLHKVIYEFNHIRQCQFKHRQD